MRPIPFPTFWIAWSVVSIAFLVKLEAPFSARRRPGIKSAPHWYTSTTKSNVPILIRGGSKRDVTVGKTFNERAAKVVSFVLQIE